MVTSIAHQLRADRRRRERRRRVLLTAVVIALAVIWAVRLVAEVRADAAGAAALDGTVATAASTPATVPSTTTSTPTGLDPGLVRAYGRAQAAAADEGHRLSITSGFRTAAEQAELLEEEIAERGSRAEALWWVFPPERSMHVQGLAVDVGDGPAADWLAVHGARFGLCRTLDWEWWHFEWRARWEASGRCPAPARTPDDAPQR